MNCLAMPNLHGLTLFIWIVSVLTLSIGDEIKTDGTTSMKLNLPNSEPQISSTTVQPTPASLNVTNTSNNVASSFVGEGGPISIVSTTQRASTASHLDKIPADTNVQNNLSQEQDATLDVTKHMTTVSKIVPRKGANEMLNATKASTKAVLLNDTKTIVESSTTASNVPDGGKPVNSNNSKSNGPGERSQEALNATTNGNLNKQNVSRQSVPTSTVTSTTVKEHKAKPTVTVAGPNSDKGLFVSSVRSHLGMPKKIDYVLPVIVTLVALPVLGAIMFMVYKQGRDCWDKRHYRRMDFLIDGMYND